MQSGYIILAPFFFVGKQKKLEALAAANKTNPTLTADSALGKYWAQIKENDFEDDVFLDSNDICKLIELLNFDLDGKGRVPESNKDYPAFFKFIARCPEAAKYVASLLTGEDLGTALKKVRVVVQGQPVLAAANKFKKLIDTGDYHGTYWLFKHLFEGGQRSTALLEMAAKKPGGIAVLMEFNPALLASMPVDDLLSLASSTEENLFKFQWHREDYLKKLLVYLITHRKQEFTNSAVANALFPVRATTEEPYSAARGKVVTPAPSTALPSRVPTPVKKADDLLSSPGLAAIAEEDSKEAPNPAKDADMLSSPGIGKDQSTPASSKLASPQLPGSAPRSVAGALDFADELTGADALPPPPTPQRQALEIVVPTSQTLALTTFKKYLLRDETNDKLMKLFLDHPDVFYNFLLHAKDDELEKLLAIFPDPLKFFETTQKVGTPTIKTRIFDILAFLAKKMKPENNSTIADRLEKFFTADNDEFGRQFRIAFGQSLQKPWYDYESSHKTKIVAIIENPATRKLLKLKDKPEFLVKLVETINLEERPRPGISAATCASYAMHAHLADDADVMEIMAKNKWEFLQTHIPGATKACNNPLPVQEDIRPAHNFYLACHRLKTKGLVKEIEHGIAAGSIDDATAFTIAKYHANEFRKLGPNSPLWKNISDWWTRNVSVPWAKNISVLWAKDALAKVQRRPEVMWTAEQLIALNPILAKVWNNQKVDLPSWEQRRPSLKAVMAAAQPVARSPEPAQSRVASSPAGLERRAVAGAAVRAESVNGEGVAVDSVPVAAPVPATGSESAAPMSASALEEASAPATADGSEDIEDHAHGAVPKSPAPSVPVAAPTSAGSTLSSPRL